MKDYCNTCKKKIDETEHMQAKELGYTGLNHIVCEMMLKDEEITQAKQVQKCITFFLNLAETFHIDSPRTIQMKMMLEELY